MIVLAILFIASLVFAPWWLVVILGLLLMPFRWGAPIAVGGAAFLDAVYGAPVAALAGFSYIYTALFILCAVVVWFLSLRMAE